MTTDAAREQALRERLAALTPAQRAAFEAKLAAPESAAAPAPSDPHLPFPMTDIQQAYWAGRTGDFEFGKVATHSYTEIDADDLDLDRLGRAWNRLVARHPMLRAIFLPDGAQQVLADVPLYRIAVEDSDPADVRAAMSHRVLPVDRWPIFEIRASRIGPRRTRIHLSFDAIVADISSRRILVREWGLLYRDPDAELPPLTASFRDFVLAEKPSEQHTRARAYWLARADTLAPAPQLPLLEHYDRHAPPRFTRRTHTLPRDGLDRLARQSGVSLNALLLTAYADVLRLWSAGPAFALNLTLFNRPPGEGQAAVVGDFTALTLLEIDAPGDAGFAARARALQERLWRDLDHRHFSGVELLREIAHRRGGPAMMPVVFTSVLSPGAGDTAWLGEEGYAVSQTPQVWIDLMAVASGDGLVFHWNSVDALFPAGMMEAMFGAFIRLLERLDGDARWPEIARMLVPQDAREAANATEGPRPTRLLHVPWKDHARTAPDSPAVITPTRTLSHAALATLATNLAHRLRALGLKPNTLAAVVMPKGWEQVAAVLAILEAGGAYLPIDPDLPAARLHYLLADAGAQIALTLPTLAERLDWPEGVTCIAVAEEDLLAPPLPPLEPVQSLADLAYVIHTSGSTGQPKGVAIDHLGAANTIEDVNARFGVGPSDRVLALSALSFDLSVYDIFGVLGAGGAVVLPDPGGLRDPAHWVDLIARHGVTLWNSVPALAELLADYAGPRGIALDLRLALLSGDRIAITLPDALRTVAPNARVISLGGATEASIWSIWHDTAAPHPDCATITYGKPMRNQRFHVLGPAFAACPTWVAGALHIGGIGLARGYWGDEAKTEAAFVTHPDTGERLYRTGDRGRYLPDGSIEFLGRDDTQVKLRGFRVELGEIEAALAAHPAVREAVVTASGATSSERSLAAYVVAKPGATPVGLTAWLRERLPGYMIPAHVALVAELPLTPNGKIDRARLPVLDVSLPASSAAPQAEPIARIVRQACRIAIPAIDSSFLDLGLTSIDMIRIVNAIDHEFGYRPGIEALYAAPTIHWLAECHARWLEGGMSEPREAIAPAPRAASTGPTVALPAPAALSAKRRTIRRFTLDPIPLADLSGLLAAAMPADGHRPYGSASGVYPVRVHLFARAGRIAGLAPGAYRYDPEAHALEALGPGTLDRTAFAAHNAPIFDEAAFALFLVADMDRIAPRYGERALHLATIEAGLLTQALELAAPSRRLGLCQIGSADEAAVRGLLGLSGSQPLLHTLFGGHPDPSPVAAMAPDPSEEARLARLFERVARLDPESVRAAGCAAMIDPAILSADQAALLDALLAEAAAEAPAVAGSPDPKAVPIRAGDGGAPLFVIHGSGGRVLFLHALARHLPAGQAVYGVEAPTRDSGEDGAHLCRRYAAAIRAVQPHGPYRIGGYSAGCLIAFAVAALLDVEFLLLIDPAPLSYRAIPEGDAHQRLARRLEMAMLAGVTPLSPEFPQIERVDRALARIARDLRAVPIAGRIHTIHGTRGGYVASPATLAQWAGLADGGMARAAVEADHFGIVRDPHAAETASHIRSWLEAIDGRA